MALKKKPVNGMRDVLPAEAEVRDYVEGVIRKTYRSFGFTPIETPLLEEIGNLTSKQGGENEKLIFKVMKRGEKLNIKDASTEEEVVDYGMRYDLTVPLSRYFSNNENELEKPFKALQIGPVFRADRPQKGRYRQFTQCDIDILGEPSNLAECELITATTTALSNLGFSDFNILINDRRILKSMADFAGFPEERLDTVFIILDKMDKVGKDGVRAELIGEGFSEDSVNKYLSLFEAAGGAEGAPDGTFKGDSANAVTASLSRLKAVMGDSLSAEAFENLSEIERVVTDAGVKGADFDLVFDPTLVRGMGYYTGTIFEIRIKDLDISCGGGGRYDNMVGLFAGHPVPACGFSIGFERIILILLERKLKAPGTGEKTAILLEKGLSAENIAKAMAEAKELREKGKTVLVTRMMKNKKFQKEGLEKEGYLEVIEKWQNQ